MIRSVLSKAAWVGRTASMVFGLALVLALLFGVATVALGATGGNFILGNPNTASSITQLTANIANPAMKLINTSTSAGATALNLQTASTKAPMTLNSKTKVANLNADQVDGKDFAAVDAREVIDDFGPLPITSAYTSKGGTLIISASGSGFRSLAFAQKTGDIGMRLLVDGSTADEIAITVNQRDIRHSFVADQIVVEGLPAGTHTIRLEALYASTCNTANESPFEYCTTTNGDDRFNVTVVEIPD